MGRKKSVEQLRGVDFGLVGDVLREEGEADQE
jgi:hypothetical protein